jgi:hypothetical protein
VRIELVVFVEDGGALLENDLGNVALLVFVELFDAPPLLILMPSASASAISSLAAGMMSRLSKQ